MNFTSLRCTNTQAIFWRYRLPWFHTHMGAFFLLHLETTWRMCWFLLLWLAFAEIIPRKMGRIWCHMRIIPFMYPFLLEMSIRSPFAKNQFLGAKLACKYWVLQKERRHCFEDCWGTEYCQWAPSHPKAPTNFYLTFKLQNSYDLQIIVTKL